MSLRNKILRRVGIQPEPELVERASRRERWRRQGWMFASTAIAFGVVIGVSWLLSQALPWFPPTGVVGIIAVAITTLIALMLDLWLFGWGIDRFDITRPWQFREEQISE